MKNIIVLEGADSSGKTTLAKAIGSRFGGEYFHGLPFVGWVEHAHRAMLIAAARHDGVGYHGPVVIDRHWISEYVYGPIFRDRIAYDDGVAEEFDREIRAHGVYVLCVPGDAAEHERRFQRERPEKKDLFDTMSEVAENYRRLAHGYIYESNGNLLQRYMRHGDFALRDCLVYDLDTDGRDIEKFVGRILEECSK